MKKFSILLCLVCCFSYTAMAQFSLGDLLGSSSKQQSNEDKNSSIENVLSGIGSSISNSSTGSDDITSVLGDIINSAITYNQELTVADLEGRWVYAEPACKFKSSDFLKSAGGEMVASQVSSKLTSFYKLLGFKSSTYSFTFENNGDFVMKYSKLPISGNASRATEKGYFMFEFVKMGSYSLTKTPVYIEIAGDKMLLLFEIDEFVAMFKSLVGKLGVSTLNKIFTLVDSYDGILIGFEMTRQ